MLGDFSFLMYDSWPLLLPQRGVPGVRDTLNAECPQLEFAERKCLTGVCAMSLALAVSWSGPLCKDGNMTSREVTPPPNVTKLCDPEQATYTLWALVL